MVAFLKKYGKTLLFFGLVGLIGGFFTGIYALDSCPAEIREEILSQIKNENLLGLINALQAAGYGVILGAAGIWLGRRTGMWKDETHLEQKPLLLTGLVALIGGVGIIVPDLVYFGRYSQAILDSYAAKPTVAYILASVLYGGVIEEVMLRLFMMSLLAFLLHQVFGRKEEKPGTGMLIAANVIAALLFAAGHLPSTAPLLGITPMIVFRCFLLNGSFGLLFGWLYRKYGLRYAMLAHAGCHVVSKLIWILFV